MPFSLRLSMVLVLSPAVLSTCYFPNGNVSYLGTACNPNAIESACCAENQACLSNGLCVSDPHAPTISRLHRGACTDKAWKSGNCPRACLGRFSPYLKNWLNLIITQISTTTVFPSTAATIRALTRTAATTTVHVQHPLRSFHSRSLQPMSTHSLSSPSHSPKHIPQL